MSKSYSDRARNAAGIEIGRGGNELLGRAKGVRTKGWSAKRILRGGADAKSHSA